MKNCEIIDKTGVIFSGYDTHTTRRIWDLATMSKEQFMEDHEDDVEDYEAELQEYWPNTPKWNGTLKFVQVLSTAY